MVHLKLNEKQIETLNIALSMAVGFSQEIDKTKDIEELIGDINNQIEYGI